MLNVDDMNDVHIGILTGCENGMFKVGFNGPLRFINSFSELLFSGFIRRTDDGTAYELTTEGRAVLDVDTTLTVQSTPSEG